MHQVLLHVLKEAPPLLHRRQDYCAIPTQGVVHQRKRIATTRHGGKRDVRVGGERWVHVEQVLSVGSDGNEHHTPIAPKLWAHVLDRSRFARPVVTQGLEHKVAIAV